MTASTSQRKVMKRLLISNLNESGLLDLSQSACNLPVIKPDRKSSKKPSDDNDEFEKDSLNTFASLNDIDFNNSSVYLNAPNVRDIRDPSKEIMDLYDKINNNNKRKMEHEVWVESGQNNVSANSQMRSTVRSASTTSFTSLTRFKRMKSKRRSMSSIVSSRAKPLPNVFNSDNQSKPLGYTLNSTDYSGFNLNYGPESFDCYYDDTECGIKSFV
jgi:hypothetical protein